MNHVPGSGEGTPEMSPQEQIADLMNQLATSQAENMALRATAGRLNEELVTVTSERDAARAEITALTADREASAKDTEGEAESNVAAQPQPRSHSTRTSLRERLTPRRLAAGATMAGTLAVSVLFGASFVSGERDQARAGLTTHSGQSKPTNPKAQSKSAQTKSGSTKSAATSHKKSSDAEILAKAESDDTVAEFLHDIEGDHQSTKDIIRAIFAETHSQRLDHDHDSMSSLRALFKDHQLSPREYAIAVADSIKGSEGFTAETYNALKGNQDSGVLPQGESVDQARQTLEDVMTAPGTTFSVEQPGGTFMNHGQDGEGVFKAGIVQLTEGDQSVFVIHTAEGKDLYFKVFNNNCVNVLTKVTITLPAPVVERPPVAIPVSTAPAERPHPGKRRPHHRRHRGVNPHAVVVTHQPQPTPPSTPPKHPTPAKHDKNGPTNVAGNTGENSGTGIKSPATGPGVGDAGQTPDTTGSLPTEAPKPIQTPDPTPAPIETQPAPTSGGEQGTDTGQDQAPSGSTNTGGTTTGDSGAPTG